MHFLGGRDRQQGHSCRSTQEPQRCSPSWWSYQHPPFWLATAMMRVTWGHPCLVCSWVVGSGHPRPGFTRGVADANVSRETSGGQPKPLDPLRLEELTRSFCLSKARHDDRGRWVDHTLSHLYDNWLRQAQFRKNLSITGDLLLGRFSLDRHQGTIGEKKGCCPTGDIPQRCNRPGRHNVERPRVPGGFLSPEPAPPGLDP